MQKGEYIDMTGERYGKLVVIEFAGWGKNKHPESMWLCRCDCGNLVTVRRGNLYIGHTKSCGCIHKLGNIIHGHAYTPTYKTWISMISRCENINQREWKNYGGRGITICESWRKDFINFLTDMGEKPGKEYSIERIDNSKGYSPENCKWGSVEEQQNNRRTNHYLTYNEKTQTITQWGRELGINPISLSARITHGWSVEKTLMTPIKKRSVKNEIKSI